MKWIHSIITKISIIFALALIGVVAILYMVGRNELTKEIRDTKTISAAIIRTALNRKTNTIDFKELKNNGFTLITNDILKNKIIKNKNFPKKREFMGMEHMNMMQNMTLPPISHIRLALSVIPYQKRLYIAFRYKNREIIVLKTEFEKKILPRLIFPIISIFVVIFLYIAIIRSILPLYDLRKKVKEFADGNLNVNCSSNKKDEIAILSNEFDNSVRKIKKLRDSRQLFLRNIMHELKTPITKGKLACEMIENSIYQKSLQNVFRRQEDLLNEFSRIEKLNAGEIILNKNKYNLIDVIDYALDILPSERDNVSLHVKPYILNVDFEFFGTALKNLLDNGINYSNDKKVKLSLNKNAIIIENKGPTLEFPIEKYSEPYLLEGSKQKSSRGLGFGLYITWHIIKLHGMRLSYKRVDDINVFTIANL